LRAPNFFTLNLHDWLISSGNRPDVLNKMISLLLSQNYKITTTRQIT
jgi:peptidoglycan/xylan/chitin deacetylase (PgdA/CDA1 family)